MRNGEHLDEYRARIKEIAQQMVQAAAGRELTVAEFKDACDQAKVEVEKILLSPLQR